MDDDRIAAIYQTLEQARVPLPPDQQGPGVLLEKLREVRRWQDAVIGLSTEVMRETAGTKKLIRALQVLATHAAPDGRAKQDLNDAKDRLDDLRSLEQAIRVCRNNLKTTESDIRLCSHLLDLQFKLGEIQPPKPADAPAPTVTPFTKTGIEGVFAPPVAPVATANARGPLPRSAPEVSGVVQAQAEDVSAFLDSLKQK